MYEVKLYLILVFINLFNHRYISLIAAIVQFDSAIIFCWYVSELKIPWAHSFQKADVFAALGIGFLVSGVRHLLSWHLRDEAGGQWLKQQLRLCWVWCCPELQERTYLPLPTPPKSLCSGKFLLNLLDHHFIKAVQIDFS